MTDAANPRRRSAIGPIILIAFGVLFLLMNFYPNFDPWPILARYWPLILIFLGLGHIWDSYRSRQHPEQPTGGLFSGTSIAWIILLVLFIAAVVHRGPHRQADGRWYYGWGWRDRDFGNEMHDTQSVELQGAKSVSARLELSAGRLKLTGGSNRLLDADFRYGGPVEGKPEVQYHVSGDEGQLEVTQKRDTAVFGRSHAEWDLRFGGNVPLTLDLNMGAGQTDLDLDGLTVNRLEIHMGAGELNLDLTGVKTSNLDAVVEGGAGQARIYVPKDIGTRVRASGGLGSINVHGLTRDGDAYVNEAYGKTSATIDMTVNGGVGEIDLTEGR